MSNFETGDRVYVPNKGKEGKITGSFTHGVGSAAPKYYTVHLDDGSTTSVQGFDLRGATNVNGSTDHVPYGSGPAA